MMALLLLLLSFCSRSCAVTLPQPFAVAARVGSSVNLSCFVQVGADPVTEKNLYWYTEVSNNETKSDTKSDTRTEWFVFPDVEQENPKKINANSISRTNPKNNTDMTLTIDNVALRYTGTYVCHMSVRINSRKRGISGNGTYLLVHEPLHTYINGSGRITCSTEVWEVDGVSLMWDVEGAHNGSLPRRFSHNSYQISAEYQLGDQECGSQRNVTGTCFLQYRGMNLTKKNLEIRCPGRSESGLVTDKPQPVLLYILLLAGSLLILLIIILVFYVRRRRQGDNLTAVYINFEDKKRPNKSLPEMDM